MGRVVFVLRDDGSVFGCVVPFRAIVKLKLIFGVFNFGNLV